MLKPQVHFTSSWLYWWVLLIHACQGWQWSAREWVRVLVTGNVWWLSSMWVCEGCGSQTCWLFVMPSQQFPGKAHLSCSSHLQCATFSPWFLFFRFTVCHGFGFVEWVIGMWDAQMLLQVCLILILFDSDVIVSSPYYLWWSWWLYSLVHDYHEFMTCIFNIKWIWACYSSTYVSVWFAEDHDFCVG